MDIIKLTSQHPRWWPMAVAGAAAGVLMVAGCGASSKFVETVVLPTSSTKIDVVQHRSSTYDGCAELVVLQTYSAEGRLLDSQAGRGRTLPCGVVEVSIEAGSRIGSAVIVSRGLVNAAKARRPDSVTINNANSQGQYQGQEQGQGQGQSQTANGGAGGGGGGGGNGGQNGNNGNGNGGGDGGNPGTDNHHDNGDND